MAPRRPKSITPSMQWFLLCEAVEHADDGGISFRRVFDSAMAVGFPVQLQFTASVQFRGGTGEHKFWIRVRHPKGIETATDEASFWLMSKTASHRHDTRVTLVLGPNDVGKFEVAAILDGREVYTLPLSVEGPRTSPAIPGASA